MISDPLGLPPEVEAEDAAAPLGGLEDAAEHPEGRRLASAVRAEEAVELARLDPEVDVVDRREGAEPLGEPLGQDRGLRRRLHRGEAVPVIALRTGDGDRKGAEAKRLSPEDLPRVLHVAFLRPDVADSEP
jgi:hypothetical protein